MQFIDQAEIEVQSGSGGDGMVAFRREKYVPAGGPAGGNGGAGGSVYLKAVEHLQTLLDFQYARIFKAKNGQRGGPKNMTGASADDLYIEVPCGTVVYDIETDEIVGDLVTPGQTLLVAQGGKGGLGNRHFLSNRNRAPENALPGLPGEERAIRLELKLLAEVGIIGLPNAGKSTLISALSAARPKIADYPFTTLIPNLGVVRKPTGDGTVFADIPGLIEGAHQGAGLGHDFLRHIERTRLLLHLIDVTSEDPIAAYETIQAELEAYDRGLPDRPQILAVNKIDALPPDSTLPNDLAAELHDRSGCPVFIISAVSGSGLDELLPTVWQMLDEIKASEPSQTEDEAGIETEFVCQEL
ncbi:GTPase ObgE [Leptolyngbya sp. FACHB-711]|uniref:GTPase ObgE n=1 Tax=unclassified Leptolyngbya TaxID=2650499 RepID=UPI00168565D0|nr:GTPase ObgE [Leptolyngbya sp. FACHB-711]MBD1852515.1 GTPase ObgE [Cyanobacteria bacterium FACHB-502]MBD2027924.1 GTPase ObgE [Leptolyngbya sp. FACHB-711]